MIQQPQPSPLFPYTTLFRSPIANGISAAIRSISIGHVFGAGAIGNDRGPPERSPRDSPTSDFRLTPAMRALLAPDLFVKHHDRACLRPIAVAGEQWRRLPRDDVLGRFASRVDPSTPRAAVARRWWLEFERLPVRVQDQVDGQPFPLQVSGEGDAVGLIAPVGLAELHAVPRLARSPDHLGQTLPPALVLHVA